VESWLVQAWRQSARGSEGGREGREGAWLTSLKKEPREGSGPDIPVAPSLKMKNKMMEASTADLKHCLSDQGTSNRGGSRMIYSGSESQFFL